MPGGDGGGGGAAAGDLRTGFAVISSVANLPTQVRTTDLQVDSTVAAVTVDAQGKIVDVVFDAVQTKINFTTEGNSDAS